MEQELFERASKLKIRFETAIGVIAVDDLWDLPLTSQRQGVSLDDLAKDLNRDIKAAQEESFVVKASAPAERLQVAFNVVKRVIEVKIQERDEKAQAAAKKEQKQKIMALIAEKKEEGLKALPVDQLEAMLAEV